MSVDGGRDDGRTRRLEPSEIGAAGAVLARGFHDDPLFVHLLPDPTPRARLLPAVFAALVRDGVRYGHAETTADGLDGVAVWLPPGRTTMTPGRMLGSGALSASLRFGRRGLIRFLAFVRSTEGAHKRAAPMPHWSLPVLAVEPARGRMASAARCWQLGSRAPMPIACPATWKR